MSALPQGITGRASIEGDYRYDLTRDWHTPMEIQARTLSGHLSVDLVLWIMLNPSKAAGVDPETGKLVNDPTLRKCIGFTQRMGFRRLVLCNLFALRSTDPSALLTHADPVGPKNDLYLTKLAEAAACIVVGWGAFEPKFLAPRVAQVRALLGSRPLLCLGANADGSPGHPLFIKYEAAPRPWPVAR